MTKKLRTVRQVMELSIQHHVPPEIDPSRGEEAWTLEAYLETLPPEFASALRAEIVKGTLVVSLVPGGVARGRSKSRPPKAAPGT
ncbi:MAG: hypothetical protein IPP58_12460 [Holophagaceae bacterium]|uniref:Uncharacterized protein n=1 Tax=Candidatus Geothrix skivensis TaxID=2954439 RepID=A0A9D7XJ23_9BACT|nr:hypothetical protein [Candidatus Geothrix skivensis]